MIFGLEEDGTYVVEWGCAGDLNAESVPPKLCAYQPPSS